MQQHKTHLEAQRRAYTAGEGRIREAVRTNNPTFVHQPPPPESRIGDLPPLSEANLPLAARRVLSEAKAETTRLWERKTTTDLGRTRVNNAINRVFHRIGEADFAADTVHTLSMLFSEWAAGLVRTACEESFEPVTHPPATPVPEPTPAPSPSLPDWLRTPEQAGFQPIPMVDYPVGGTLITQHGQIPVREPPGDLVVYSYETTLDRFARALQWQGRRELGRASS